MKFVIKVFVFCFLALWSNAHSSPNQTILVTGGAGFIGSNFVKYMFDHYRNYQIIVLDKFTYSANIENLPEYICNSKRFTLVEGDICDPKVVDELMGKSDFVVHLAAESDVTRSIANDEPFFISNVMGTRNLLHFLVKHMDHIQRFIYVSSSGVYGNCLNNEVIDEGHPLNAKSPYAASKAGADRVVYSYGCTYNAPVVTLRFFNNYGPRQHLEKAVAKFIAFALSNQPLIIHGTGGQMRDWVHVFDAVRAIDAAIHIKNFETIRNEVINCGSGVATSVLEIARKILSKMKMESHYMQFTQDRPGQVTKQRASTIKAKAFLGWEARIGLDDGLSQTIEWYREHPDCWRDQLGTLFLLMPNDGLINEKTKDADL